MYGPYKAIRTAGGFEGWEPVEDEWDDLEMDTVYFDSRWTAEEVKRALVGHDNYPDDIQVRRED